MRSGLILVLVFTSVSAIFSAVLTPSVAVDYTKVGVEVGDTAQYQVSEITHVYKENFTYYDITGKLDRFRIGLHVIAVKKTIVTIDLDCYYPNGTWYDTETSTIDVSTGNWSVIVPPTKKDGLNELLYRDLLISSDLSSGDPIYPESNIVVNETINVDVAGKYRLVNTVVSPPYPSAYLPQYIAYCWDKESGLLVEWNTVMCYIVMAGPGYGGTFVRWFNLTLLNEGEQVDVGTQLLVLSVAGATTFLLIAVFETADRRLHTRKPQSGR